MSSAGEIRFGRYRLHPVQGLTHGGREVRITPKSLALLRLLAGQAGRVVTKEEVFRAVWPNAVVSDAALATCIRELRRALQDDARRPRYIETLHRRGYRFLPAVTEPPSRGATPRAGAPTAPPIVGRDAALDALRGALHRAAHGERQVVLVTGEPGIGKTALVRAFFEELRGSGARTARADCVERHGAGEAYQPLLEALTRLAREADGGVVTALRRHAPTWLAHLPALQTPAEQQTLQRQTAGATPPRMLRELNDCLEALAGAAPLVLCLEDVHWSDRATLDWLAAFARRSEPARILLVITYRTGDPAAAAPPLQALAGDLRMKGLCREIALQGLDEPFIREYVLRRYPPAPEAQAELERLAGLVYRHTEGNPLFVVNVLGELARRSLLRERNGAWDVPQGVGVVLPVPEDVRRMIEQRIDALDPDERTVLEAASVVPGLFSAAAVAAGVESDAGSVEHVLRGLARRQWFVREAQLVEWPDGTLATGLEYTHALYRETLRQRLPAARRAELHRRIGQRLELAYGERAPEIAADLALHFDRARELRRAIVYLRHAAATDRRRAANKDAEARLRRALALLKALPSSAEHDELEVSLRIALGGALMAARGFGAPEVEDCFARASHVCQGLSGGTQTFPVQWGLWLFYLGRGSIRPARKLADRLLAMTVSLDDPDLRLQAHHALWATALSEGDLAAVERHAHAGMATYDPERHASMAAAYGDHDPGVCALVFAARAAALAGRTATAVRLIKDALALAGELAHPFTVTLALALASFVQQSRGDLLALRGHAAAGAALAREHGFALMLGWLTALDGWALARLGEPEQGLRSLREGIAAARSTGSALFQPVLLALEAEAELGSGLLDDARRTLATAAEIAEANGDRLAAAEIERLEGELRLAPGAGPAAREEGERRLRAAIEIATAQGAALLALRAGVRLGRLYAASGRVEEARRLVAPLRERITEEPALPEVVEAGALGAAAA